MGQVLQETGSADEEGSKGTLAEPLRKRINSWPAQFVIGDIDMPVVSGGEELEERVERAREKVMLTMAAHDAFRNPNTRPLDLGMLRGAEEKDAMLSARRDRTTHANMETATVRYSDPAPIVITMNREGGDGQIMYSESTGAITNGTSIGVIHSGVEIAYGTAAAKVAGSGGAVNVTFTGMGERSHYGTVGTAYG